MRVKGKSKDPKRTEADKKRVQSMIEMKKGYKLQKDFIQSALSSVVSTVFIYFYAQSDCIFLGH